MPSTRPHSDSPSLDAAPAEDAASDRAAAHRAGDILDVHLLDIAAQLEALLRSARHVQQAVLKLRGALPADDTQPVEHVRNRLGLMRREWDALGEAIQAAADAAERLTGATPPEGRAGR